jgi:histidyl-tRNA synthetase
MENEENTRKERLSTQALSGFMELLPAEQIAFNTMLDMIRKTYETYGFTPIETPILERAEVLLAKAGGETEKQIYRFSKGDTDLAMRFDLTVPLARYVAEHRGQLTFPFRRYAIGKVYRGERPQAGRFREFYQCDIDVIGDGELSLRFDAEIPSIIGAIFRRLGFERFTVRINNRRIFNGLFAGLGISRYSASVMQSIDRLEKIGRDMVKEELLEIGIDAGIADRVLEFVTIEGSTDEIMTRLEAMKISDAEFVRGVADLREVVSLIRALNMPESNFVIDLTIARGLDYYTGTVFETRLDDFPEIGSVCSGGRYDNLAEHYTNRTLPGVGISIGLTRLFDQLNKRHVIKIGASTPTQALVVPLMPDLSPSLDLASRLRESGISTEVWFGDNKIKKSLGYADKLGIPFAILLGTDEIEKGGFSLKDLKTGQQQQLKFEALLKALQRQ